MNILKKLTKQREFFIFFVIICIMVAMTIYSPIFLTFANLSVLFLSLSIAVIIAVGMTNLMVSGGSFQRVCGVHSGNQSFCNHAGVLKPFPWTYLDRHQRAEYFRPSGRF